MGTMGGLVQGVSVVTTTWNERENIGELVRRVRLALKDVPHEVIVIDDNSSDGTLDIAKLLCRFGSFKTARRANQRVDVRNETCQVSSYCDD